MYNSIHRVREGSGYSEEFGVKVGVHQGFVLSPLLFIIMLYPGSSAQAALGCCMQMTYDMTLSSPWKNNL